MNTRPRRDHIRKPGRRDACEAVAQTMAHFSRVARKPVWFSYDDLWDIEAEARRVSGSRYTSRMTTASFPSRGVWGHFVSNHLHLRSKIIKVKIFPDLPLSPDNTRDQRRYAFFHLSQHGSEGVDYAGGVR